MVGTWIGADVIGVGTYKVFVIVVGVSKDKAIGSVVWLWEALGMDALEWADMWGLIGDVWVCKRDALSGKDASALLTGRILSGGQWNNALSGGNRDSVLSNVVWDVNTCRKHKIIKERSKKVDAKSEL